MSPRSSSSLPPHIPLFPSEYPELQRIKRELSLLAKLYSLYNCVIDSVAGYYDILWADLNIEKINNDLQDFQNKYSREPDPDPALPLHRSPCLSLFAGSRSFQRC